MCDLFEEINSTVSNLSSRGIGFASLSNGLRCDINDSTTDLSSSPPPNRVSLNSFPEYIASQILYQSNLWIFWVVGLLGNTACLLTVRRLKPFSSVFIYIGCLAVCDILYLTVKLVYEQMRGNLGYLGIFGCSPLLYVIHWSGKTSHWIILFMTADRLVAVCAPFKVSQISTKKNVTLAMIGLVAFQAIVNCHYLFSNQQTTRGGMITCGTKPEYRDFRTKTLWLFFALSSIIPCGGVLLMNIVMGIKLYIAAKSKLRMTAQSKEPKDRDRHSLKVTTMLMTVSAVFVLLVTPGPIFYLYVTYWNYSTSVEETALYYLVRELVNTFINADHAINFFLYFLSGTKFRRSFLSQFHCCRQGKSGHEGSNSRTRITTTSSAPSMTDFNKV